ncbi:MAG: SigB/SigF/SigG family RNA polymerase sigma factor [Acidimicrobiia bacterium]|nr:SigB/SigF/SigG family RNA polymerase sigma factor [Acidimicrobiia bacterium]
MAWADGPETDAWLKRLDDDPNDAEALDGLVRAYTPMAEFLARRFRGRNVSLSDLEQTAKLGLIKALRRFDPERGFKFSTYGRATIVGELKKALRDRAWPMRIPRRLQEDALRVRRTSERMAHDLGRVPDPEEVAERMDRDEDEILEAMEAGSTFTLSSLDQPMRSESGAPTLGDTVGRDDQVYALVERLAAVEPAIRSLPERQRRILYLRFYEGLTQSEIGERVGVSQVHVSRLLSRALGHIRRLSRRTVPPPQT